MAEAEDTPAGGQSQPTPPRPPIRASRRRWVLPVLTLVVLLAVFEFGRYRAGFDRLAVHQAQRDLTRKLVKLTEANTELRARIASLERSAQVDAAAYAEIKADLLKLQEANQDLREKLTLYRTIVSPEDGGGLRLQSVKILPREGADLTHYQVTLAQAEKTGDLTRGYLRLWVDGWLDGALKRLELGAVSVPSQEKVRFEFKYLQTLEGDLRLPEGFKPLKLVVKAVPEGGEHLTVEGSYPWPGGSAEPAPSPAAVPAL